MKLTSVLLIGISLMVFGAACGKQTPAPTVNTSTNTASNESVTTNTPDGTIMVAAGDGVLTGAVPSTVDFIAEISTGKVAYLGSKGATANYTVTAPATGTYSVAVNLSDDGTWSNGFRDADVTVNGTTVLHYAHSSQDTRGWKWFTLGNVSLKAGENTVAFTKSNNMPAAYSMLQFRLTPVIIQ